MQSKLVSAGLCMCDNPTSQNVFSHPKQTALQKLSQGICLLEPFSSWRDFIFLSNYTWKECLKVSVTLISVLWMGYWGKRFFSCFNSFCKQTLAPTNIKSTHGHQGACWNADETLHPELYWVIVKITPPRAADQCSLSCQSFLLFFLSFFLIIRGKKLPQTCIWMERHRLRRALGRKIQVTIKKPQQLRGRIFCHRNLGNNINMNHDETKWAHSGAKGPF